MAPKKKPTACLFPTCVAFAVDGRDHCPVHSPEKVLERATNIVLQQFNQVIVGPAFGRDDLNKLKSDILRDLKATV